MPTKGNKRGPIFTLDTDMFLELWKNNQLAFEKENASALKGLDLREGKEKAFKGAFDAATLKQNYRSLCLNIFSRSVDSYNTEDELKAICAAEAASDKPKLMTSYMEATDKASKDDAAYLYIKDKVLAKAKNIFEDIGPHNEKILMPIGYTARNHGITKGPKRRDWEKVAAGWG